MMKADLILFDLDGTLTDSAPGITRSVQYALTDMGKPQYSQQELNTFVGPPLYRQFMDFAGFSRQEAERAVAKYRERYSKIGIYENEVYPGIPELLAYLKGAGKLLGVASSKPQVFVEEILRHFQLKQWFTVIAGAELNGSRIDKEDVVEEALRLSGYQNRRDRVILVGDRKHDALGARKCGITCIGVSYGYGGRRELEEAGAALVVDRVEDLRMLAGEEIAHGTKADEMAAM